MRKKLFTSSQKTKNRILQSFALAIQQWQNVHHNLWLATAWHGEVWRGSKQALNFCLKFMLELWKICFESLCGNVQVHEKVPTFHWKWASHEHKWYRDSSSFLQALIFCHFHYLACPILRYFFLRPNVLVSCICNLICCECGNDMYYCFIFCRQGLSFLVNLSM
jgi:hypothetical protein